MNNFTTNTYEVKRDLINFSKKIQKSNAMNQNNLTLLNFSVLY